MDKNVDANVKMKINVNNSSPTVFFYSVYAFKGSLVSVIDTNLDETAETEVQKLLTQRLQKGLVYGGHGSVVSVDLNQDRSGKSSACYFCSSEDLSLTIPATGSGDPTDSNSADNKQYIVCFISTLSDHEEILDIFRVELDEYSSTILKQLASTEADTLTQGITDTLTNWHKHAIEYLTRCRQSLQDNLKYLIHCALLDNRLVLSGGTDELQTDIRRFYRACSLSDILSQLKESRLRHESSLSGSVDMLLDMDGGQTDARSTITVSISAEHVKLDSNACTRFCDEWGNALNRAEFQDNPTSLKKVIEAFKLKFIQTMNTLKRLLREAENDYYALYRSYVFLRDSGNSEILLHYVTTESVQDTASILTVLQEFITEVAS